MGQICSKSQQDGQRAHPRHPPSPLPVAVLGALRMTSSTPSGHCEQAGRRPQRTTPAAPATGAATGARGSKSGPCASYQNVRKLLAGVVGYPVGGCSRCLLGAVGEGLGLSLGLLRSDWGCLGCLLGRSAGNLLTCGPRQHKEEAESASGPKRTFEPRAANDGY